MVMKSPPKKSANTQTDNLADRFAAMLKRANEIAGPVADKETTDAPFIDASLIARLAARGVPVERFERVNDQFARNQRSKAAKDLASHRRDEVRRMSREGLPVAQIAAKLGMSYHYVVQLRGQLGLSKPRKRR